MRTATLLAVALAMTSAVASAQTAPPPFTARMGVDERLDRPAILAPALTRSGVTPADLPLFVNLRVSWTTIDAARASNQWVAIDGRLDIYARLSIPVMVSIEGSPAGAGAEDSWRDGLRAAAEHLRGRVAAYGLDLTPGAPMPTAAAYAFLLKIGAVQLRAVDPAALIAQTPVGVEDLTWQTAVYDEGTAAYVDVAPLAPQSDATAAAAATAIAALVAARDPSAALLWRGVTLGNSSTQAAERWLTAAFDHIGPSGMAAATFDGSIDEVSAALTAASQLQDVFQGELVSLDEAAVALRFRQAGRDVTGLLPHRLLYNPANASTYVVFWSGATTALALAASGPITIALIDQSGRGATLRDAAAHSITPVPPASWDPTTKLAVYQARLSPSPLVLDFNYGAANVFAARTEANATATLSVDEIVVRHQQAQAVQDALYRTVDAALRIQLHFRASAAQVFDVISENRFFQSRDS
ncbi:MAG: hypothetical protein ABI652_04885, partial [Acidobacteriota bacterium]